jgi:hypothetical protein
LAEAFDLRQFVFPGGRRLHGKKVLKPGWTGDPWNVNRAKFGSLRQKRLGKKKARQGAHQEQEQSSTAGFREHRLFALDGGQF